MSSKTQSERLALAGDTVVRFTEATRRPLLLRDAVVRSIATLVSPYHVASEQSFCLHSQLFENSLRLLLPPPRLAAETPHVRSA